MTSDLTSPVGYRMSGQESVIGREKSMWQFCCSPAGQLAWEIRSWPNGAPNGYDRRSSQVVGAWCR